MMITPNLWYTAEGVRIAMHVADPFAALMHFQATVAKRPPDQPVLRADAIIQRDRRWREEQNTSARDRANQRGPISRPAGPTESPGSGEEITPAAGRTGVRLTSAAALANMRWTGELNARQAQMLEWMLANPSAHGHTRQEVARGNGWGVNPGWGRVAELIAQGTLEERGTRACRATSRTANAVHVK